MVEFFQLPSLPPAIDKSGPHLCYFLLSLTKIKPRPGVSILAPLLLLGKSDKGETLVLGVAIARRTERNIAAFMLKPGSVSRITASVS